MFNALRSDVRFGYVGLVLWMAMFVATVLWGLYHLFYILFILGYLLVVTQIEEIASRFEFARRVISWRGWQHFVFVVTIALAIRWLILYQDQVISGDLATTVSRSTKMLEGLLPYMDFSGGTKPPAYQYMLYVVGYTTGSDAFNFRVMYTLADAVVAGLVYAACRTRYAPGHSLAMGIVYAMCPVSVVTIGLSARYEGVVNIFLIASLWTFLRGNRDSSALLLGVAFSLKIYPLAVLPFLAIAAAKMAGSWDMGGVKRWLPVVRYGGLFALPAIGSLVPLAIADGEALSAYFAEKGVFIGWGSYTTFSRRVLGTEEVAGVHVAYVFMAIFGLLLLWMFIDWLRNDRVALRKWVKVTVIAMAVQYGFYFALTFQYYGLENWELYTLIFLIVWFPVIAMVLRRLLPSIEVGTDEELSLKRSGLPMVGAMALILFVYAMPTIGTWYYLWPLPFVLVIGPRDVRETFLWMLFWHGVGGGVSFLPGMPPIS